MSVLFVYMIHIVQKRRKRGECQNTLLKCNIWFDSVEIAEYFYIEYDTMLWFVYEIMNDVLFLKGIDIAPMR